MGEAGEGGSCCVSGKLWHAELLSFKSLYYQKGSSFVSTSGVRRIECWVGCPCTVTWAGQGTAGRVKATVACPKEIFQSQPIRLLSP